MTRDELLASLELVGATHTDAVMFDGENNGKYLDWSTRLDNGDYVFEAGDELDAVQMWLDRDELVRLHAALTLTLLRDEAV